MTDSGAPNIWSGASPRRNVMRCRHLSLRDILHFVKGPHLRLPQYARPPIPHLTRLLISLQRRRSTLCGKTACDQGSGLQCTSSVWGRSRCTRRLYWPCFSVRCCELRSIVWWLNIHSSGRIADFRSGDGACKGFYCVEVSVDSSGLQVSSV
jgi:hypothetical protein